MTVLNGQSVALPSTVPTLAAAANGGDGGPTGPNTYLLVTNSNAATRVVTVAVPGNTWNGVATPDTAITVPAIAGAVYGMVFIPLDSRYNDPALGRAAWTYSTEVGLSVAVLVFG